MNASESSRIARTTSAQSSLPEILLVLNSSTRCQAQVDGLADSATRFQSNESVSSRVSLDQSCAQQILIFLDVGLSCSDLQSCLHDYLTDEHVWISAWRFRLRDRVSCWLPCVSCAFGVSFLLLGVPSPTCPSPRETGRGRDHLRRVSKSCGVLSKLQAFPFLCSIPHCSIQVMSPLSQSHFFNSSSTRSTSLRRFSKTANSDRMATPNTMPEAHHSQV